MMRLEVAVWMRVALTLRGTSSMTMSRMEGAKVRPRREAACTKALLNRTIWELPWSRDNRPAKNPATAPIAPCWEYRDITVMSL